MDTQNIAIAEALSGLGDVELDLFVAIASKLEQVNLASGDALIRAADTLDALLFVGTGRVSQAGQNFGQGAILGWDAFLHQVPTQNDVIAERATIAYRLPRAAFDELTMERPELWPIIVTAVSRPPQTHGTSALTPAKSGSNQQVGIVLMPGVDASDVDPLLSCFNRFDTASAPHVLRAADCAELADFELTQENLAGPRGSDLFSMLEQQYGALALIAEAEVDAAAWQSKVADQVDCLVVILHVDQLSRGLERAKALLDNLRRPTVPELGVVLLGDAEGTSHRDDLNAIWEAFVPKWHYWIKPDQPDRWESVARMSLGIGVHLVLAGGGSLGALHCGLLSAMREEGFPIDSIGGTSIGGCISLAVGLGHSLDYVREQLDETFVRKRAFRRYTYPKYGLVNPEVLDKSLQDMSQGAWMEESEIPIFVLTTNLNDACSEIVRRGPAWQAMRMTSSLPVLLPPYLRDGKTYVDGALVNNFPSEAARSLYRGRFVGLNLSVAKASRTECEYDDRLTALGSIANSLGLANGPPFPSVIDVLIKSMMLMNAGSRDSAMAGFDYLFELHYPGNLDIRDFSQFDKLFEIGYSTGKSRLAAMAESGELQHLRGCDPA